MTISRAAGFPVGGGDSSSGGVTSVTVSPAAIGDLVIVSVFIGSASITVSGMSGGHATGWARAEGFTDSTSVLRAEIWTGTATATGSAAVTVTFSASISTTFVEIDADSLHSSTGGSWSVVASGGQHDATGTSNAFPSLTATVTGQAYWGIDSPANTPSAGSTTGFTYNLLDSSFVITALNAAVTAGAVAPSAGQSPTGTATIVAIIVTAGGTSWSADVSQTVTVTDTAATTLAAVAAAAQTITATDTAAAKLAATAAVSQAITATATAAASGVSVFDTLPAAPTYPLPLLDTRVELNLGGTWTNITSYVYERDPVTITRGHPDESTTTAPSSAKLTLNNRDGRFSDLNPVGPYYGLIGQNTPLRISVPEGASYLRSETDQASYAECPDTAGISITGDMELQLDLTLGNWNGSQLLAAKWAGSGQASWLLLLWNDGTLQFQWSQDGTSINAARTSVPFVPPPLRRMSLRITLAVATGTVTYYTGPPGLSSPSWTQLGPAIVLGANNVFDSTAALQLGYGPSSGTGFPGIAGKIHAAKLLSGIGGTTKASPDFTAQAPGATSFADAQSNTWTLNGTAEISNRKYRFHGECSAWPQAWDATGTDVWAQITASGILRRLGQNASGQVFQSAMRRAYVRLSGSIAPVAYWPCEDGTTATQLASALGGPAMQIIGIPSLASDSAFLCSLPIPVLNSSTWAGMVPAYSGGTDNVMRFLMHIPAGGDVNGAVIARMYTSGPVARVDVVYSTGGGLALNLYSAAGGLLATTGAFAFGVNGKLLRVSAELQASGADIHYNIATLQPGGTGALVTGGTLAATAIGNATQAVINPGGLLVSTSAGHVSVQPVWDTLFDLAGALKAWVGETAGVRFKRLCAEESITFRGQGNLAATVAMGPQAATALTTLLQECADADRGSVTEPRQAGPGLGYRTRGSMLNQSPAVTLSYTAAHLSDDLAPTRDDQQLQNDVTVSQGSGGSSSEQVLASGPLSIQAPPNGAGRYAAAATINVATASQLDDAAGWMVWMGTVNQPRYPVINVNLARAEMAALYWALQDMDLGDYLQITGTPLWLPPGGVNQLIQGVTEVPYGYVFHEAWACVPQAPWNTAVASDLVWGHADTDGSVLHTSIGGAATSMLVDTTGATSPLWTTSAGDFPFDILVSGERITVTNITGASSPQAFTITRSVNGVVKAQSAGTDVRLFFPPVISL